MNIKQELMRCARELSKLEREDKIKKLNAYPQENRAVIFWQWKASLDFKTFKEIITTVKF